MEILGANISASTYDFFYGLLEKKLMSDEANTIIHKKFGIKLFFEDEIVLAALKHEIFNKNQILEEPDRAEYGDFQTNSGLANKIVGSLLEKQISPTVIIEPTCGKGNFIIACLQNFETIKYILGVEIYKPYVWETKLNIIDFFLSNPLKKIPEIEIKHANVFDFDFKGFMKPFTKKNILVIGNPPWITNSELGTLSSSNLPKKSNFKNVNGFDALTGKGNFDIGESIALLMLRTFEKSDGYLALLVKNAVIKNIVFDQLKNKYSIAPIEKQTIDSKKEFNVSVEASLFFCCLNKTSAFTAHSFNFYNHSENQNFGWINEKFVSNIENYEASKSMDGICQFEWRQGLKHDCAAVMELDKIENYFLNGLKEKVELEDEFLFGLLKSSDLKGEIVNRTRKFTIVTQKKIGAPTQHIESISPKTFSYLLDHLKYFEARKSSIYINKPAFSIFGIGDYSFKNYKVAISGLYKSDNFTLITTQNEKPIMLDDTCYFIGFDDIEFAVYTLILLNLTATKEFLKSITFPDAKRTYTKDILMRINLYELAKKLSLKDIQFYLEDFNIRSGLKISTKKWQNYFDLLKPIVSNQLNMFSVSL